MRKLKYKKAMDIKMRAIQTMYDMTSELSEDETDAKLELMTMRAEECVGYARLVLLMGRAEKDREIQEKMLSFARDIVDEYPQMEEGRRRGILIEYYTQMAGICEKRGDVGEAATYYGRTLRVQLDKAEESGDPYDRLNVAYTYQKVGNLGSEHGNYEIAREYYGKALDIYEEMLTADGTNYMLRDSLGLCCYDQGQFYRKCGEYDAAKESCVRAVEVFRKLAGETDNYNFYLLAANCTTELGHICMEAGELQESAAYFQDALKQYAESSHIKELGEYFYLYEVMFDCCDALWDICEAMERTEDFAGCCMPYLQVIEDDVTKWEVEGSRFNLGLLCNRLKEWEKAQENYFKAAGKIDLDTEDPEKLRERIDCMERAAYATLQMEEYYTAAVCYEEALDDREKLVKLNPTAEERCGLIGTYRDIITCYAYANEARDVLEYGEMAIDPARELAQETNDPEHRDLCGEIAYYLVYVTEGEKRQKLWKECCSIYERLADEYPDSERYARLKDVVAKMMGN